MHIRKYLTQDKQPVIDMIKNTIQTVNIEDYSLEQVVAWANFDENSWRKQTENGYALVALVGSQIVGFCDMDQAGYLDHLFVHAHYQGQGIATYLLETIEGVSDSQHFSTHASITALPFFIKHGYTIKEKKDVTLRGQVFRQFFMEKTVTSTKKYPKWMKFASRMIILHTKKEKRGE